MFDADKIILQDLSIVDRPALSCNYCGTEPRHRYNFKKKKKKFPSICPARGSAVRIMHYHSGLECMIHGCDGGFTSRLVACHPAWQPDAGSGRSWVKDFC